jgi:hypothetical protein
MIRKYGYRSVYLATDDDETIAATRNYPEVNWLMRSQVHFNRTSRTSDYWQIEDAIKGGGVDGYEDMMGALTDVLLMGDCEGLVGKFTSNLDRIAYSLMSAKGAGCMRPFASLDSPWYVSSECCLLRACGRACDSISEILIYVCCRCFDFAKKLPRAFFEQFGAVKNKFERFYC